jgi:type IV pilus assembly protein PilQ
LRYSGERLSLNFRDIDVRTVLQVIADFNNFNIVTSDSVGGTVTLRLKDVPWDQALDIILQSKGLGMRRSGDVMLIAPLEELASNDQADLEIRRRISELEPMRMEAFQLNYTSAEEVARGLLGATIGSVTGTNQSASAIVSSTPAGKPAQQGLAPSSVLSSRGSVIAVVRTNQLFVTDIPAKIEQVRSLIKKIDIPVKQVMIEARIVEASDSFGKTLGARLGVNDLRFQQGHSIGAVGGGLRAVVAGNYLAATTQTLQPGAATPLPSPPPGVPGQAFTNSQFVNLPAAAIRGTDPATFAMSLFGAAANRFLNLEISALEADGRGKVVSNPRIVTADQVEAYIKQGFRVPYRGGFSSPGYTSQVQFQEAILKLAVTPQITPEGHVILSVMVNKDSLGAVTSDGREINTKEIKTKVLVENGGTVVIGGIYEQEEVDSRSKVPLLSDLPVLGRLFQSSGRESRRTELLVFLRPSVLGEPDPMAR